MKRLISIMCAICMICTLILPAGTVKAKGFLWSNTTNIVPVTKNAETK